MIRYFIKNVSDPEMDNVIATRLSYDKTKILVKANVPDRSGMTYLQALAYLKKNTQDWDGPPPVN